MHEFIEGFSPSNPKTVDAKTCASLFGYSPGPQKYRDLKGGCEITSLTILSPSLIFHMVVTERMRQSEWDGTNLNFTSLFIEQTGFPACWFFFSSFVNTYVPDMSWRSLRRETKTLSPWVFYGTWSPSPKQRITPSAPSHQRTHLPSEEVTFRFEEFLGFTEITNLISASHRKLSTPPSFAIMYSLGRWLYSAGHSKALSKTVTWHLTFLPLGNRFILVGIWSDKYAECKWTPRSGFAQLSTLYHWNVMNRCFKYFILKVSSWTQV